jgi:hypothetical protein
MAPPRARFWSLADLFWGVSAEADQIGAGKRTPTRLEPPAVREAAQVDRRPADGLNDRRELGLGAVVVA